MKQYIFYFYFLGIGVQLFAQDHTDWPKSAVWYQIFPERFASGNKNNDNQTDMIQLSWPYDNCELNKARPWTSDWYELQADELKNGKDFWHNAQKRRYGGDLEGMINKLDYLSKLGINALYINPLFWAPSLHKYDGMMYHHIDPYFGNDPETDIRLIQSENPIDPSTWQMTNADQLFLTFIKACHERGIKVVLDGVFNHLGEHSFAFKDVRKKRENSEFKDWFIIHSFGDKTLANSIDYQAWFGVKSLPEINENENGFHSSIQPYLEASVKRWMDPNQDGDCTDGIDGWRLDVAFCVHPNTWKQFREMVKSINPNCYLFGELFHTFNEMKPYLADNVLDASMNYPFTYSVFEYFVSSKYKTSNLEFERQLNELLTVYGDEVPYFQMNLLGSHDTPRFISVIENEKILNYRNWGKFFNDSKANNPKFNVRKPSKEAYDKFKAVTAFQFTFVGAPYIYYGDEAGMWGANDPCDRKPMLWNDLQFAPEKYFPNQKTHQPDEVVFNEDLFQHFISLTGIRKSEPALQFGDFKVLKENKNENVFIFQRNWKGTTIQVMINRSNKNQQIEIKAEKWINLIDNQVLNTGKIKLDPNNFMILRKQN
jgi:glycosidase